MNMMHKIYIIAGEPSGDALGADLMQGLRAQFPGCVFYGIGGLHMEKAGLQSLFPMSELSIMGLFEIIPHLFHIRKRIQQTVDHIISIKPDVLVTIDSSGFTHRVIKKVKYAIIKNHHQYIPAVHLAAPPVWAWRPWRAKSISKFIDHLLCLFPFEPAYFIPHGMKATFVGHPVIARIKELKLKQHDLQINSQKSILILPGSRISEIKMLLPIFIEAAQQLNTYEKKDFTLVTLPHLKDVVASYIPDDLNIRIVTDAADKEMTFLTAHSAIAASGTVSLELAAFGVPHLVAYKTSYLTGILLKLLVKIPYVALPNIIAKSLIVPELLQQNCTSQKIFQAFLEIDHDAQKRSLQKVCEALYPGGGMPIAARCAHIIEENIHDKTSHQHSKA
ncbi:MAG: lipid-A-disaccharide synthase [Alphaproteobacteria bacterium]|nr:lipid-A-disaccharide synthase [Alphaproteobacteria bacterium]